MVQAKNDNSVAAQARANKAANAVDSIHTPHWLLQTYVPSPHLMNGHRKYAREDEVECEPLLETSPRVCKWLHFSVLVSLADTLCDFI